MTYSKTMADNERDLRDRMKIMLERVSPASQDIFRRMYNPKGTHEHTVDAVPFDKLDWAFKQIENTLLKQQAIQGDQHED